MPECTTYSSDCDDGTPCQCPVCKGWIKWVWIDDEMTPVCNKCKTPLVTIPDADSTEDYEWGKICAIRPMQDTAKKEGKL